jgi:hypothetical protein
MPYALREQVSSAREGKDIWYRFWTKIGPCCTSNPKERALLAERNEWFGSLALQHSLTMFEIVELPEGSEGDFDWNKP